MVVEIKQTDTPEEVKKKLQVFQDEMVRKENERKERIKSFFGILKRDDINPIEIQRKLRDEWD
jgi:CRISPR/Cas system-associated exonuclease Cas4 (RecB family)